MSRYDLITGRASPSTPPSKLDKFLVFGSKRSGKSAFMADDLIRRCSCNREENIVYYGKSVNAVKVFTDLVAKFAERSKDSKPLLDRLKDRVTYVTSERFNYDEYDTVYVDEVFGGLVGDALTSKLRSMLGFNNVIISLDKSLYSDQPFIKEVRDMGWHIFMLRDNPKSQVHKYPTAVSQQNLQNVKITKKIIEDSKSGLYRAAYVKENSVGNIFGDYKEYFQNSIMKALFP